MQIPGTKALLLLPFLSLSTGCASLQEPYAIDEGENDPPIRLDYIDDRLDRPIRQISLLAGLREFSDDEIFGRVDGELALGLEYAHEIEDGLGFEVGAQGSLATDNGVGANVDVTGAAAEIYGGGRYFFKGDSWQPYVGAGLTAMLAGVDNDQGGQVADDQSFTLGLYLHGGINYLLSESTFLGLDLRGVFATDLELETISGDADYLQLGLVFGFRL